MVGTDVCKVVYMVLYMVWDIQWIVMGVVYAIVYSVGIRIANLLPRVPASTLTNSSNPSSQIFSSEHSVRHSDLTINVSL